MKTPEWTTMLVSDPERGAALRSPLRLEILGLFTGGVPLAIADMARLMGRTPGSLYYHVDLLERARLLKRTGTRPKGKRWEALFFPAASRFELEAEKGGASADLARKTVASAFRMAERDFAAALARGDCVTEGPGRNALAARLHLRVSRELLAAINRHVDAFDALLRAEAERNPEPAPEDQHLSLTIALLPLRGRGRRD